VAAAELALLKQSRRRVADLPLKPTPFTPDMLGVHAANPTPEFDSIVHLPAPTPGAARVDAPCRVLSFRGNRLALLTDREIPPCVPLSVEHDDALYLGEVVKSGAFKSGNVVVAEHVSGSLVPTSTRGDNPERAEYHVEILIEQVLSGLQSLVTLRARLLDEAARADERIGAELRSEDVRDSSLPTPVRKRRRA